MIDWNRVAELKMEIGDEDFVEVIEMFFEEVTEALEGLSSSGPDTLSEGLHFVKGSAVNVGLVGVSDLCNLAENALRANSGEGVDIKGIRRVLDASIIEFRATNPAWESRRQPQIHPGH